METKKSREEKRDGTKRRKEGELDSDSCPSFDPTAALRELE